MLALTGADITLVVIWVIFMRWIYANLFPPHQMLLIHGDISPDAIIGKLASRQDKFRIREMVHIREGIETVLNKIDESETVLIGDIPAHERNIFLKYCFARNIRCYSIPKISDIMITSAEKIELFDSP